MGDAAEKNDGQVGEASGMDVDLHTGIPQKMLQTTSLMTESKPPAIAPTEGRDREEPSIGRGCSRGGSGLGFRQQNIRQKDFQLPSESIAIIAQSVTVEHTGAQGRIISPEEVQTEVDELPTFKSKERPIV